MSQYVKYTQDQFIEKARATHGDKYDYRDSEYLKSNIKIKIICNEHGAFVQTPAHHIAGNGCLRCHWDNSPKKKRYGSEFVTRAMIIHGNKYDYSLVKYNGADKKVLIICPIHGAFEQTPNDHLHSRGCNKCGRIRALNAIRDTKESFIKKATMIHSRKYDYSLLEYKGTNERVIIICPKHGIFNQKAHNHLQGSGCPSCKISMAETRIGRILYSLDVSFIREKKFTNCKIIRCMKFDFYIPKYNLLIEYHGGQHFVPWKNGNNLLQFMKIKRNDEYKKRWAIENKYFFKEYTCYNSWRFIEADIKNIIKSLEIKNI